MASTSTPGAIRLQIAAGAIAPSASVSNSVLNTILDSTAIQKWYLGSTEVTKVYLGSTIIHET